jgi:hypothetical protein
MPHKIRNEDCKKAVCDMHFYQLNNISLFLMKFYLKVEIRVLLALAF